MKKTHINLAIICLASVLLGLPISLAGAVSGWSVEQNATEVTLQFNGDLFSVYRHGDDLKYPFLYPVNGPATGQSVTTHNTEPWPHHSSLFFSCDKVNGMNFWQPTSNLSTGQIRTTEVRVAVDTPERVVLEAVHEWARPGEDPIMRDRRRISFSAPFPSVRQIDFVITLDPLVEVTIERNNHSLFAARMAKDLAVTGGGALVSAKGDRNQEGTFGKTAPWLAGLGSRGDKIEGLVIFSHPSNRWHEPQWFTRDYGFISPTPMQWLSESLVLPVGVPLTLRYRVWVIGGSAEEAALIQGLAAAWTTYEQSRND